MKKTKICVKCLNKKYICEFWKRNDSKDWFRAFCKCCRKTQQTEYIHTINWLLTSIYSSQKERSKLRWHNQPSYTKEELKKWILSQDNFHKLFEERKESWYEKNKIPSIDRLDDYKWYSFDNIQLITWEENNNKWHKDRKEWVNNKNSKAVIWTNIKTWEVTEYYSTKEASRVTSTHNWNLVACCKWNKNNAWWYIWKYKTT